MKKIAGRLFIYISLALLSQMAFCASKVVLVTSDTGSAYVETMDSMVQEMQSAASGQIEVQRLTISEFISEAAQIQNSSKLIVTLGSQALKDVSNRGLNVPVMATLVPRSVYERVFKENEKKIIAPFSVLYMDQPLGRQLDLIHLALPQVKTVGVLFGPDSASQKSTLVSQAERRKLLISSATVEDGSGLFAGLKAALDGADVLLALADSVVFNASTVSNIFLSSYRSQIPVIGFSPAYTKAGAMLSLFSTPTQIGIQSGAMARSLIAGSSPVQQYPADFSISVNEMVARSLSLNLDAASLTEKLRRLEKKP